MTAAIRLNPQRLQILPRLLREAGLATHRALSCGHTPSRKTSTKNDTSDPHSLGKREWIPIEESASGDPAETVGHEIDCDINSKARLTAAPPQYDLALRALTAGQRTTDAYGLDELSGSLSIASK
jgi:hypothetical protein